MQTGRPERKYPVIGFRVSDVLERLYRDTAKSAGMELSTWLRETIEYRIARGEKGFKDDLRKAEEENRKATNR